MIEIRAARPEDAAAIAHIHTDSWEIAYRGLVSAENDLSRSYDGRLKYWKQRLVHSPQGIFLAEDDALGPMGFVAVLAGWIRFDTRKELAHRIAACLRRPNLEQILARVTGCAEAVG